MARFILQNTILQIVTRGQKAGNSTGKMRQRLKWLCCEIQHRQLRKELRGQCIQLDRCDESPNGTVYITKYNTANREKGSISRQFNWKNATKVQRQHLLKLKG